MIVPVPVPVRWWAIASRLTAIAAVAVAIGDAMMTVGVDTSGTRTVTMILDASVTVAFAIVRALGPGRVADVRHPLVHGMGASFLVRMAVSASAIGAGTTRIVVGDQLAYSTASAMTANAAVTIARVAIVVADTIASLGSGILLMWWVLVVCGTTTCRP